MEHVKVLIVGGGAAGLGAAKTLGAAVDYRLIEAQDYLGGRIRNVDAGACRRLVDAVVSTLVFYTLLSFVLDQRPM